MLKTAFLLSALTVVSASAAFAAPPATAQNPSHHDTMTYSSSAVPVLPDSGNPNVPGATGRTIVPGDNSTIAGDHAATLDFRSGAYGGN